MSERTAPLWPGWETVKLIGRGSFGAVYEIQRIIRGRTEHAALKVLSIPQHESEVEELRADGYDDDSITKYFADSLDKIENEYAVMADLKGHANVVYCDDIRTVQRDSGYGWDIYIKMELLTSLKSQLGDNAPEDYVIKLGCDICNALKLCEELNVVHRDIKPENIFIARDGNFKLGDFGIAKTMESTTGGTKTGTYDYMAPEVYNNQPYHTQADIYSLGLVMYWILNERTAPFLEIGTKPTPTGKTKARERRFSGEAIPAPKNGSEELKNIVLKACAYDIKERYQSAQEMWYKLNELRYGNYHAGAPVAMAVDSAVQPGKIIVDTIAPNAEELTVADEGGTVGPIFACRAPETQPECRKTLATDEDLTVGPAWNRQGSTPLQMDKAQTVPNNTARAITTVRQDANQNTRNDIQAALNRLHKEMDAYELAMENKHKANADVRRFEEEEARRHIEAQEEALKRKQKEKAWNDMIRLFRE